MTFYKHKNNTDVAFISDYKFKRFEKEDFTKIRVNWYNIVNKNNIYPIALDTICIKDKDWKNWEIFNA